MISLGISPSCFLLTSYLFLCLQTSFSPILKTNWKQWNLNIFLWSCYQFSCSPSSFSSTYHKICLYSLLLLPCSHCLHSHSLLISLIVHLTWCFMAITCLRWTIIFQIPLGFFIPQLQKPLQHLPLRPLLPSSNISLVGTQDMANFRFSSSSLSLPLLPIFWDHFFPNLKIGHSPWCHSWSLAFFLANSTTLMASQFSSLSGWIPTILLVSAFDI